jgi:undecaprenyl-diphosphatase
LAILQAIILGLLQGITEFIPISSSAHLIIVPWLFGWTNPALTSLPFDVSLHLGTLLAVLSYFAQDWLRLIKAAFASIKEWKIGQDTDRRFIWFLLIATIPGAIVGILAEGKIETLFHQPNVPVSSTAMLIMAIIIALWGLLMFLADELFQHVRPLEKMSLKDSILLGLSQAMAIFPGVSRSGTVITAGLALKFTREAAARFSIMLSAPIIAGAGLKSMVEIFNQLQAGVLTSSDLLLFVVGFVTAAVSGFFCIRFLLRYLQTNTTRLFVYYRWGVAVLIVLVALTRGF